ncbi:MAG: hypothetical protein ABI624_05045 [Casimicrobiaceae bacterium]
MGADMESSEHNVDNEGVEGGRRRALAGLAALAGALAAGAATAQDATRAQPLAFRVVLENDAVRVLEFVSRPGMGMCGVGRHSHPAHLTIALSEAKVRVTLPDGRRIVAVNHPGDVVWSEAESHTTENVGGANARALIVEIKGPAKAA